MKTVLPCNDCEKPATIEHAVFNVGIYCANCYDGAQWERQTPEQYILRRRLKAEADREEAADRQRAEWKDEGR